MRPTFWRNGATILLSFLVACAPRPEIENDEPGDYWVPPLSEASTMDILGLRRDIMLHHTNFEAWIPKSWSFRVAEGSVDKHGSLLLVSPSADLSQTLSFLQVAHSKEPAEESLDETFERLRARKGNIETRWVQDGQRRWIAEEGIGKDLQSAPRHWIRRTLVDGRSFVVLAATPTTSADLYSATLARAVESVRITNEAHSP